MSNEVFPVLPGIKWGTEKAPQFKTRIKSAVSGFEVRHSDRVYPTYGLKMSFEFLRASAAYAELQAIVGLFLRHKGAGESFLLLDADDKTATNQVFGIGTGSQTVYQLMSAWGGLVQPVCNIQSLTAMAVNGIAQPNHFLSPSGVVTFSSPPPAGSILTWSGTYYYRCRFADDTLSPRQLWSDVWELGKCELVGALGKQIG